MEDDSNQNDSPQTPQRVLKVGRPSKLTREILEEYCKLIQICQYIDTAAAYLGIERTTVHRWLARGRRAIERMERNNNDLCAETEVVYVEFFNAHKRAMSQAEVTDNLTILSAAAAGSWQAAAWRQERRHPGRYGNQNRELRAAEKQLAAQMERNAELEAKLAELAARLAPKPAPVSTVTPSPSSPSPEETTS